MLLDSNIIFVLRSTAARDIHDSQYTEQDYQRLVHVLDTLVDEVGEDETHPLASLMEVVGALIERYEDEYVPELMDE